jgi:hypothetical protein
MGDGFIYDDGGVALDRQGITLRRYYFPIGTSKHIPYRRIRRVEARPMGWLTGKGRVWGSVPLRYWLPLDIGRPRKDTLVVLDIGGHVKPAFSPDHPDRVLAILHQQTDRP